MLIESEPSNANDLRYLLRYADSFRETKLASGEVVRGSGMAVIFADVLKAVVHDIPIAISLSLWLTLITVFFAFRRGWRAGSWCCSRCWWRRPGGGVPISAG